MVGHQHRLRVRGDAGDQEVVDLRRAPADREGIHHVVGDGLVEDIDEASLGVGGIVDHKLRVRGQAPRLLDIQGGFAGPRRTGQLPTAIHMDLVDPVRIHIEADLAPVIVGV